MTEGRYGGIDEGDERPADRDPVDPLERDAVGLPPLSAQREPADPPQLVRLSVLLWLFAGVLVLAASGVMIASMDQIAAGNVRAFEEGLRAGDKLTTTGSTKFDVTPEEVREGTPGMVWLLAVGSVMLAVLVVVFGYRLREGTRSARSVLIALTALLAAFAILMPPYYVNFTHWAAVVVAVVALIPPFLPQVAEYFPKLPRTRRSWRQA